MLMEQLNCNLPVVRGTESGRRGMGCLPEPGAVLKGDGARRFFQLVVKEAQALDSTSDEHFTVDGTLMEACASPKSFQKVEEVEERKPKSMIPAIRRWAFMARSGANQTQQ